MSGVVSSVFGDSGSPGILGTGQFRADQYTPDGSSFKNQSQDEQNTRNGVNQQLGNINSRQTPTSTAASAQAAQGQAFQLGAANTYGGAQVDTSQDQQMRGNQNQLIGQLQQQANGQGPSLATEQMKAATQRNAAQQFALAASTGGSNPALAQRNAMLGAQQLGAQTAQDSAQARIQEQTNARAQLAGALQGARSQDQAMAMGQAGFNQQAGLASMDANNQFALQQGQMNQQMGLANMQNQQQTNMGNAGFQQQSNLANQQAQLGMYQENDQANRGLLDMQNNMNQFDRQSQQNYEQLRQQGSLGYNQINSGAYQAAASNRAGIVGGIAGGMAGMAMMSDENQKTDVTSGNDGLKNLMNKWSQGMQNFTGSSGGQQATSGQAQMGKAAGMAIGKMFGMGAKSATTPAVDSAVTPTMSGYGAGSMAGADIGANGIASMESAGGADAAAAVLSDEQQKRSIHPDDPELHRFYDALEAHSYRYKDPSIPGAAPGRFVSPMAQELEKSDIGRSMVHDTPNGKVVNYERGLGAMLAGQAMFNERLNSLEEALKGKSTLGPKGRKGGE